MDRTSDDEEASVKDRTSGEDEDSELSGISNAEDSELSETVATKTLIREEGLWVDRVGSTTSVCLLISHFSSSSSTTIPTGTDNMVGSHTWSARTSASSSRIDG